MHRVNNKPHCLLLIPSLFVILTPELPSLSPLSPVSCICQQALFTMISAGLWLAAWTQDWPLIGQYRHRKWGAPFTWADGAGPDSLLYLMSLQIKVSGNHWETECDERLTDTVTLCASDQSETSVDIVMTNQRPVWSSWWPMRGQKMVRLTFPAWCHEWEGWEDVVESEKMDFIEPGYKYIKISHWPAIGPKSDRGTGNWT